jgi:hypothetical protein
MNRQSDDSVLTWASVMPEKLCYVNLEREKRRLTDDYSA